jgi:hypothetical protein
MPRRAPRKEARSASPAVRYGGLGRQRLEAMLDAGHEVRNCMRVLAKSGSNIVAELLHLSPTFYEWDHYPKGDVFDPATHAQYYYHAHPPAERPGEHGHFHTFLRPAGMPRGIRPLPIAGRAPPPEPSAALSHLVAIGMDQFGAPVALFSTNRWVTDETWYRAEDVIRMLDFFEIDLAHPSWPVNRWVSAMIPLFRPQIEWLLRRRDETIAVWQKKKPRADAYEDRALDITSEVAIDVEHQIAAIEQALARAH